MLLHELTYATKCGTLCTYGNGGWYMQLKSKLLLAPVKRNDTSGKKFNTQSNINACERLGAFKKGKKG
jgi:hypothetical protein